MKSMTIRELDEIRHSAMQRRGMAGHANTIIAAFISGGFDVCEIEPEDFGRTEEDLGKHTNAHMRKYLSSRIEELGIQGIVTALTSQKRLFLVRNEPDGNSFPSCVPLGTKSA